MSKKELVVINAEEYGIPETKALEIKQAFVPMLDKMEELENEFNDLLALKITDDTCVLAHDLRLKYVKIRTGTAEIHKEWKGFYLQGGKFVDGWKNAQLMASQGKEGKLRAIEDHFINLAKEKIAKLQEERTEKLHEFEPDMNIPNLGEMADDVWSNYINGVKLGREQINKAKAQAETDRLEEVRIEGIHDARKEILLPYWQWVGNKYKSMNLGEMPDTEWKEILKRCKDNKKKHLEEQAKIRTENDRLKKEQEVREKRTKELQPYIIFIREYNVLINKKEPAYQKELADIKKGAEQHYKREAEKEAKAKTELRLNRKENLLPYWLFVSEENKTGDLAELTNFEYREILLKAKADSEKDKQKKLQEAESAPDKEKLLRLSNDIRSLTMPTLKTNEAINMLGTINEILDGVTESIDTYCEVEK